jgi:hypothetical protein
MVPHVVNEMSKQFQRRWSIGGQSHQTHRFRPFPSEYVLRIHPQSLLNSQS